ncbi:MAG: hypothetical protein CL466_01225 [Acidimicrobiaceae bacterium]|nr:hypothetical protein [Acidimicrobiaceae bacterium]
MGSRHAALGESGRIQPVAHRLRLAELTAELSVDEVARQHEGVRVRIDDGRASQPTPEPAGSTTNGAS